MYCNHINKIEREENKMKEYKQLGAYGLVISEGKILLIEFLLAFLEIGMPS